MGRGVGLGVVVLGVGLGSIGDGLDVVVVGLGEGLDAVTCE